MINGDEQEPSREKMLDEMRKIRSDVVKKIRPEIEKMKLLQDGKRLVLLNANAGELISTRKWPDANWIGLIRLMNRTNSKIKLLMIGGKGEASNMETLLHEIRGGIHPLNLEIVNLAGKTSIRELIALLNVADVFVTNDSGPMHLSALADIPTLAIFGPETPSLFAPLTEKCHIFYLNNYCSPCITTFSGKLSRCANNVCIKNISPETVFEAMKPILK